MTATTEAFHEAVPGLVEHRDFGRDRDRLYRVSCTACGEYGDWCDTAQIACANLVHYHQRTRP